MAPPGFLVDRPMADPGVEACQRFSGIYESPASCCLNRRQAEYALGVAHQVSLPWISFSQGFKITNRDLEAGP